MSSPDSTDGALETPTNTTKSAPVRNGTEADSYALGRVVRRETPNAMYRRVVEAIIITFGLVLFVAGFASGELLGVIAGLFIAVLGILDALPRRSRADRTES
ncbi:hypothetical protein [Nocardia sp. N2S4-5]|uniref:hypothetical protein n=1 Tax=Nocardia sp. N2S4-5 TaxID=3351565 RepID=UPI0037D19BF9